MNDPFTCNVDAQKIHDELETLAISVRFFDELDSTNDWALQNLKLIDLPTLVVAEHQTAGRGQNSNRWHSSSGALTFSFACLVPFDPGQGKGWLALATAIQICLAIEKVTGATAKIKWPNDIMLNDRKLGGILIEPLAGIADAYVIGIGLNVNNELAEETAEPEVASTGISLANAIGRQVDATQLLAETIRLLAGWIGQVRTLESDELVRQFAMYDWLDRQSVIVKSRESEWEGVFTGIDLDGAAKIERDGQVQIVHSARIRKK